MGVFFQVVDNNIIITNWGLIALLCIPGILYGFRRGWQEEGFTAIGLGLAVAGIGQAFGNVLIQILNYVIWAFVVFASQIRGGTASELSRSVVPETNPWAQLAAFVLIVLVAYKAGTILGRRRGLHFFGRLGGCAFGAVNVMLILARGLEIFNPLQKTTVVDPPTITILGMPSGMLKGIIVGLVAIVVALFLAIAWFQRRRARE
jgi:thiamine transporter ThiT